MEDNLDELRESLTEILDVPRAGVIELDDELEEQIRTVYDSLPKHYRVRLHTLKKDTMKNHRTSFRLHFRYDKPRDGDYKKVLAYHLGQYLIMGEDYLFDDGIRDELERQFEINLRLELGLSTQ